MPLTFAQAYAIVCPEGGVVVPQSQQYTDIMELMRQSGHVYYKDGLGLAHQPKKPRTVDDSKRYIELPVMAKSGDKIKVSKNEWLSVQANRDLFCKHHNKNNIKSPE